MKKCLAFTVFAALVYTNQSLGSNINYDFFELGYLEAENDAANFDGDGYGLNASVGFTPTLAFVLGYQDIEDGSDAASLKSLGIAYHKPYSATGDMVLGLSAVETETKPLGGGTVDGSGNEFILEIRNRSSAETEFSLGLTRLEIEDDSDSGYQFGIVSGNPQGFQFVLRYIDRDDTNSISLGLRSSF